MTTKLYVGNLSYETTEDELREMFAQMGTVESVALPTDRDTNRPRGFGFVEMSTVEEAQNAINTFNGKMVRDREIKVNQAKPQAPRNGGYNSNRNRY